MRPMNCLFLAALAAPCVAGSSAAPAQETTVASSTNADAAAGAYRLLDSDRPRFTQRPYTVDPGGFQLELGFLDITSDDDFDTLKFLPLLLKIGLTESMDFEIGFEPYVDFDPDPGDDDDGIGDTTLRLKINLWRNDAAAAAVSGAGGGAGGGGGKGLMDGDALALIPFIRLPTGSGDIGAQEVEGGVLVPWSAPLNETIDLGVMFGVDFVHDEADDSYDTELISSGALDFELQEDLSVYTELIGVFTTDAGHDHRALLGGGVMFALNPGAVLDAGVAIGLNDEAEDFRFTTGITVRF